MKWTKWVLLSLSVLLTGCANMANQQQNGWVYPPMAVPLQPTIQQEIQIARISQLLLREDLADDVRAKMHFERGVLYDNLGLRDLARIDFNQSLSMSPAQPELFNLLGVYYTQIGEFDAAYDSFDSTLELDPENEYAIRNRAIALYYGARLPLALEEMTHHFELDPTDPFRALWMYIIEHDIDPIKAKAELAQRYADRNDQWGWVMVAVMLDEVTEKELFKELTQDAKSNDVLAMQLTEGYFYLGKRYHMEGDLANAISLYKLALSFNVYEYVEHRYSFLELGRIYSQIQQDRKALN